MISSHRVLVLNFLFSPMYFYTVHGLKFCELEDDCLLGCTLKFGRSSPTFQRCLLPLTCQYNSTRHQGATTQKTIIFLLATMGTSCLAFWELAEPLSSFDLFVGLRDLFMLSAAAVGIESIIV